MTQINTITPSIQDCSNEGEPEVNLLDQGEQLVNKGETDPIKNVQLPLVHHQSRRTIMQPKLPKRIRIAVDTEYYQNNVLTIQTAVIIGKTIHVQIYYSPNISAPLNEYFNDAHFNKYFEPPGYEVNVLPAKPITSDLSPARMVMDLYQIPHLTILQQPIRQLKDEYRKYIEDNKATPGFERPEVVIEWTSHFLVVDLFKALGSSFLNHVLLGEGSDLTGIGIRDSKVLSLTDESRYFAPPIVEFVKEGAELTAIKLRMTDTNCIVGPSKLDDLSHAYLGIGKFSEMSEGDKINMEATFRDKPKMAYQYAALDPCLTLLVVESMELQHQNIYKALDICDCPVMHGTPGIRTATMLLNYYRQKCAGGSQVLNSPAALKQLAGKGGYASLPSKYFGAQTGEIHGGLSFSRSPTKFIHLAEQQLRDVDLSSCYPSIIRNMKVYLGKPVVWEPGNRELSLSDVIEFMNENAAGQDAWFIRVSGPLPHGVNALIPSTDDALTMANYKRKTQKKNAAKKNRNIGKEMASEKFGTAKYTSLYSHEVNSGIITWATWLMIMSLPDELKIPYMNLSVESVVFYAGKCVASDGESYDKNVEELKTGNKVPWQQRINMERMQLVSIDEIDESYASLECSITPLIDTLIQLRKEAEQANGPSKPIKVLTNTVYGAFASPHLPTNNVVAANVITGVARAVAFAMHLSLNGIQVITDGVSYRRDQIPSGTLAKVLESHQDYPLQRAEQGVPFLDATSIPQTENEFNSWYPDHAMRFFGVTDKPEYRKLFSLHHLEHKTLPGTDTICYDGLLCDGATNYSKLVRNNESLVIVETKARSFKKKVMTELSSWLLSCYKNDRLDNQPLVPFEEILKVRNAMSLISSGLKSNAHPLVFPVGYSHRTLKAYKIIKPSMFVFRTAKQKKRMLRLFDKLAKETGCGPETLAWLDNKRSKYQGKLSRIVEAFYKRIRDDENDKEAFKNLNLNKLWRPGTEAALFGANLLKEKRILKDEFIKCLNPSPLQLTGLILDPSIKHKLSIT